MGARKKVRTNLMAVALQAEREAYEFFGQARAVTHNPRVRQIFERLTLQKKQQVRDLEGIIRKLGASIPMSKVPSGHFPISELKNVECYVCGYVADAESAPESCPRCGASRYAFEKEISARKAWESAERGSVTILKLLGEAEREADDGTRSMIADHIRIEQKMLSEARNQLRALKK